MTASAETSSANMASPRLDWGKLDHVALSTADLDATVRFYQDVLGFRLAGVGEPNELHGRHALLMMGEAGGGMHFFEHPDAARILPETLVHTISFFRPGFLQHIAFTLPSQEAALMLQERLQQQGVSMTPIMDQGASSNLIFLDNMGIMLEATWAKNTQPDQG